MKQKAEEIYHRFVNYEWNDVSEGLKKSILEAIETALTEGQKSHIDDGVVNSENSVTVVYGKDNYIKGDNSITFAYGKGYTDINELQEDHSRIQENPLALLDVLNKNKEVDNTDEKSDISKRYSKDFKFTLKSKEGIVLLQEVVTFGTEEHPFPENWKEDHFAQISVLDYKQKFIDRNFDIGISEDTEFDI